MTPNPPALPVPAGVSARLRKDAATHEARLRRFCAELQIDADVYAVLLYLTHLLEDRHYRGASIRQVLRMLDAAALLEGRPAPGSHPHMRTFLRGLHQVAPLGPVTERAPLYLEDVHAILDAIDADRTVQLHDLALLYLANSARLPVRAISALTWNDIRVRPDRVEIQVRRRTDLRHYGPLGTLTVHVTAWPRTVAAIRGYRRAVGPVHGPMFGCGGGPPDDSILSRVLAPLRIDGQWRWYDTPPVPEPELAAAVAGFGRPRPRQLRDKAILVLGWAACLTTTEATALHLDDVARTTAGLLVRVAGPRDGIPVPASQRRHDPVAIWCAWGLEAEAAKATWAFPAIQGDVILPGERALSSSQLSEIVQSRAAAAGLIGGFSFTSLRIGFLRTALRARISEDLVARQAHLRALSSVSRHTRRERLLSDNILHRVGL